VHWITVSAEDTVSCFAVDLTASVPQTRLRRLSVGAVVSNWRTGTTLLSACLSRREKSLRSRTVVKSYDNRNIRDAEEKRRQTPIIHTTISGLGLPVSS